MDDQLDKDGLPKNAPPLPVPLNRLKPLGQRVVIKLVDTEVKTKNGVLIPSKMDESFNRLGRVLAVGDGIVGGKPNPMFVKPGDICFFQLERLHAVNSSYVDSEHGLVFFLHNLDMIGILSEPYFDLEYFHVVGSWVLVKVALRSIFADSKLVLPQIENTTHELQTYTVVQKGTGVKADFQIGDEIALTRSRCNPIYLDRDLYGWIEEKFIHGSMQAPTNIQLTVKGDALKRAGRVVESKG